MKRYILPFLCLFFYHFTALAQPTGYTDSFDGELKATAPPTFVLTQENGTLTIDVRKEFSKKWQTIDYEISSTADSMVNISAQPYVNLRLKSDKEMLLTVYLVDLYFTSVTIDLKIYPSEDFVDYFIDFSAASNIQKSAIQAMKFAPNGNSNLALQAELVFDHLKLGADAAPFANIRAVDVQNAFINSTSNTIKLHDITNAADLQVSSNNSSIGNIQVSAINDGLATITYDCLDDFTGSAELIVRVKGKTDYGDNTITIPIEVEGNNPPTLNPIGAQDALAGDTLSLYLTGISDGNITVEQPLRITAASGNQQALPDSAIKILYEQGLSGAQLTYTTVQPAENIEVTVTLDDQYGVNSITRQTFYINSYARFNNPPTIDPVDDQYFYLEDGTATVWLTGISDGDTSGQKLSLSAVSGNQNVIHTDSISIVYLQDSSTARLQFTPDALGTTTITVTVEDDGGRPDNNGNGKTEIQFIVEIASKPAHGHIADFTSFDNWGLDYQNGQQAYELGSFKGKTQALKITLNGKSCWTGTTYSFSELDLDNYRYMSYEIYFEGEDFDGKTGKTHAYFYDDGRDHTEDRNLPAAHEARKTVTAGKWHTIFLDFRSEGGMNNENGVEINVHRISMVLLNYASDFTWPFPTDNGTVYIANLRIGDAVPDSLIPELAYPCTIDPIADQTVFPDGAGRTIRLSGISNGKSDGIIPSVSAVSDNPSFITHPAVSAVNNDGEAILSYQTPGETGKARITVTVSASGSLDKTRQFDIVVVADDVHKAVDITLWTDSLYQTMRGFGTFEFSGKSSYIPLYTDELGASAVRIGIISNQIEPVNDNDDPQVLNLDGFNYGAFDFDYFRTLKEKGVETFILTSWSPPAWMKRNLAVDYGYASAPKYEETDNILEPYYYDEFAESMVAVVKMFRDKADINLYAIGLQNEPAFTEPYASAVLSPEKFAELAAIVGQRFEQEGITTKLYMPEQVFSQTNYPMSAYIDALKANPQAEKYVDIIATHSYGEDGIAPGQPDYPGWVELWNKTRECPNTKELWMSETNPQCSNWNDALSLAGAVYGALKYGNVSLWTLWDIEGSLMRTGAKLESFYSAQNFYKFIRPGARRIKAESAHDDILVTSFIDTIHAWLTTVIINKNDNPLTVRLKSASSADSIPLTYDVYTSAENRPFGPVGTAGLNEAIALPAKSVTTLVGDLQGDMGTPINENRTLPNGFRLYQNYPNPFNPITTIKYSLANTSHVELNIYNILGQKVKTLVNRVQHKGLYVYTFDASQLASGLYFYRLKTKQSISVKKMILLK